MLNPVVLEIHEGIELVQIPEGLYLNPRAI